VFVSIYRCENMVNRVEKVEAGIEESSSEPREEMGFRFGMDLEFAASGCIRRRVTSYPDMASWT